ncbi:hypothetical protein Nepgr_001771 [Nepenthes gracilis]|uniref:DUF7866 domain-containing protein n=1 Tax=Nepenthes gracilis TaxID=150966 RepID=A0AAD3P935_NEPGR|nr:hypothetical protein Nepgr_001771 [Nepenthes gracilis]
MYGRTEKGKETCIKDEVNENIINSVLKAKVHSSENVGAVEGMKLVPLIDEETKMKMAVAVTNEAIRKLGSFQICAPCSSCSDGAEGHCLLSPCCYAIKCNLPHRPFGLCSFTPMTCNCFGCHP